MSKIYLTSKLKAKGAEPGRVLNRQIEISKPGDTLDFPYDGEFNIVSPVVQHNKAVIWEGKNTILRIRHKETALTITKGISTRHTYINDLNIQNGYGDNTDYVQHGIDCSVPVIINRVIIQGMRGNGLMLTADIVTRPYSNVSHSRIDSLQVIQNAGDGVYIAGGDANQILFYHLDMRDNGGYGYHDNSFLGCTNIGAMGHLNAKGHYRVSMDTAHAVIDGCYGENGSPKSFFTGSTVVVGGLHENGVELHGNATWIRGRVMKSFKCGGIEMKEGEGITFGKEQVTHGLNLNLLTESGAFPHYGMSHLKGNFWQFFGASDKFPAQYSGREVPFASSGFQHLFIGDRLFITGTKEEVFKVSNGFQFKAGDTIFNSKFDGTNAERWVFVGSDWKEIKI